eukprot:6313014-Amphidinium_carterae.1
MVVFLRCFVYGNESTEINHHGKVERRSLHLKFPRAPYGVPILTAFQICKLSMQSFRRVEDTLTSPIIKLTIPWASASRTSSGEGRLKEMEVPF